MPRNVLGALAGIAIAVITVMLFEWLAHTVFPMPPDLDTSDTAAMKDHIANAPPAALVLVLAGYLVATFDGTFFACWIGRARPLVFALIVGGLMLVATGTNLIRLPHPVWFSIAAVAGIIAAAGLAALAAGRTVAKRRDTP